jgi:hypothetical protein
MGWSCLAAVLIRCVVTEPIVNGRKISSRRLSNPG